MSLTIFTALGMRGWHSTLLGWLAAAALAVALLSACGVVATPMDFSHPMVHHHLLMFGSFGSQPDHAADAAARATGGARYVQLSNGSRFVCGTVNTYHRESLKDNGVPLAEQMQSVIDMLRSHVGPCVHYSHDGLSSVYCWDVQVRLDTPAKNQVRFLGRRNPDTAAVYSADADTFGRYVATTYGDGDECPYDKSRHMETEVRFYCRYAELDNPMPHLSLHEASQCRYVMRLQSVYFCALPVLDYPGEDETVRCRMLSD